jgi:hypothetical protein
MAKKKIFFLLLTLLSIDWLVYRGAPTPIEHDGYRFELPMDFGEAVSQFDLDYPKPTVGSCQGK